MKLEIASRIANLIDDTLPHTGSRQPTILVAEDDFEMLRLLVWSLKKAKYEVIECQDGTTLMKKLGLVGIQRGLQPIDLVISDIRMPGATGLQVLENARGMENTPPMILISAFADQEATEKAERLGAAALLPKPFDMDELMALVRELLPLVEMRVPSRGEPQSSEADMPFPLDITFRHGSGSEPIKEFVEQLARKMTRFGEQILHCRVVIDARNVNGQTRHPQHVSLIISTQGRPIVLEHETISGGDEGNLYLALHVVFSTAFRQLKQKHQKRRPHVDKKNHSSRSDP